MEDRKQQEVAPGAMSERLDNLLAKAQDPSQIKTVKEFIADKRATEAAEAAPISSNFASYEVGSPDMEEKSLSESEGPTTSSI